MIEIIKQLIFIIEDKHEQRRIQNNINFIILFLKFNLRLKIKKYGIRRELRVQRMIKCINTFVGKSYHPVLVNQSKKVVSKMV